jgi:S1-C subfamily serine protease
MADIDQLCMAHGFESSYMGSGFFVSTDGYLLTAGHLLVDGPYSATFVVVTVLESDGSQKQYPAELIGIDGNADIAVLHTKHQPGVILTLGETAPIPGEPAMIIGAPPDKSPWSCSVGTIRDGNWTDPSMYIPLTAVLTDVSTTQGSSGSPIITSDGQVVGMHTKTIEENNTNTTTSFGGGISAVHLKTIASAMINHHRDGDDPTNHMQHEALDRVPRYCKVVLPTRLVFHPNQHRQYDVVRCKLSSTYKWVDTDGFLVEEGFQELQAGDIITHVNTIRVGTNRTSKTIGDVLWYLPLTTNTVSLTVLRDGTVEKHNIPVQCLSTAPDIVSREFCSSVIQ